MIGAKIYCLFVCLFFIAVGPRYYKTLEVKRVWEYEQVPNVDEYSNHLQYGGNVKDTP